MKRKVSTAEAARRLGIARPNLQRLIRNGRIPVPPLQLVGEISVRLWSDRDIEAARRALKGGRESK